MFNTEAKTFLDQPELQERMDAPHEFVSSESEQPSAQKEKRVIDPKKRMTELKKREVQIRHNDIVITFKHFRVVGEVFDVYLFDDDGREYSAEIPIAIYTATDFATSLKCKLVRRKRKPE
jgi:hypothetical protein